MTYRPLNRRQAIKHIAAAGATAAFGVRGRKAHPQETKAADVTLPRRTPEGILYHYNEPYDYGVDPDEVTFDTPLRNQKEAIWAVQNLPRIYGKKLHPISRGSGPTVHLPFKIRDINHIEVSDGDGGRTTIGQYLKDYDVDEFLVVQNNNIASWQFFRGMKRRKPHALYSATKGLLGSAVGALMQQGTLKASDKLGDVAPILADTAYRDVTVQQTLDMTSGVGFFYDGPRPEILKALIESKQITEQQARYMAAIFRMHGISGLFGVDSADPVDPNAGQIDFVRTLRPHHAPGSAWVYNSSDPWAVCTAIEAATGLPFAKSLSRLVWSRTGALDDARILVDRKGSADTGGGAVTTAYDLALWALLYLNHGRNQRDEQVMSEEFVKDVFDNIKGTGKLMLNDTATQFFPASGFYQRAIKEGYLGYRSFLHSGPNGSVAAHGMWGQVALMQRKVNTAIIKFGAYDTNGPRFKNGDVDGSHRDIAILNDIAETLAKL